MSTYSPNLRFELITTGDQAGTWGNTTNTNLGSLVESAVAGFVGIAVTSANQALTALNGAPDQSRNMTIALTTALGTPFAVYAPPVPKVYVVYNASSQVATIYNSTIIGNTTAAGAGVSIPAGKTMTVWSDGTNFSLQNTQIEATTTTQAFGTNNTQIATTAFVQAALQALHPVGSIYINATNGTNPATLLGFGTWAAFGAGRVPVGFDAGNPLFDAAEEIGGSADATTVSHTHSFSATSSGQSQTHSHAISISDPTHRHATGVGGESGLNTLYGSAGSTGTGWRIANAGGDGQNSWTNFVSTGITASAGNASQDHTHSVSGNTGSTGSSGTNANYQPYITVYMWKRTA